MPECSSPGGPGEDQNVRADARTDPELVDSIRDVGVLQPITVVRTGDGQYRVRYGNRRTLAAIEAERHSVPVIVAGDEDDDQVERIVRQLDENERRQSITQGDRVRAVQQLAAFGISPDQIAKRIRTRRAVVDAAVRVAQSELATAAADRYAFLDLEQAAIVADFEDDPETVKALVAAAQVGRFDHAAQAARDNREEHERFMEAAAPFQERGITVVQTMYQTGEHPAYVEDLLTKGGEPISEADHEQCPGHAVLVEFADDCFPADRVPEGWTVTEPDDPGEMDPDTVYASCMVPQAMCMDWQGNGHRHRNYERQSRPGPDAPSTGNGELTEEQIAAIEAEKQAKTEERRRVIRLNKESAEQVRRKFVQQLLTRKTAPKGASLYIAQQIGRRNHALRYALEHGHELAVQLFKLTAKSGWNADIEAFNTQLDPTVSEARAQVYTLGFILAAVEQRTDTHSWKNPNNTVNEYFAFLVDNGYTLSEVETIATGQELLPAPTE